jgi:hypothetical protein
MTDFSRRLDNRSRWLITAIAATFLYASLAHAGHWHGDTHGGTKSTICELCVGFDRIIDAPTLPQLELPPVAPAAPAIPVATAAPSPRIERGPQPRAPPLH